MRRTLSAFLICFASGLLAEEPLFPPDLKEKDFKRMQEFYRALESGLLPSLSPVSEENEPDLPAENLKPSDEETIARLFPRMFFITGRGTRRSIESPLFALPNGNHAAVTATWTGVYSGSKNVMRPPSASEEEEDRAFRRVDRVDQGNYSTVVRTTSEEVDRASGTAQIRLPLSFHSAQLDCAKPGIVKAGPHELALIRCQNDYVEFTEKTPDLHSAEPFVRIYGSRGVLVRVQSSVDPVFSGGRSLIDLKFRELPIRAEGRRYRFLSKGRATRVVVSYPDRMLVRTFAVSAEAEPEPGNPKSKPSNRYVRTPAPPSSGTVSDSDLRAGLSLRTTRSAGYFDFNQPLVVLSLPDVPGLRFAQAEWDAVLTDAQGNSLPVSLQNSGCSEAERSCAARIEGKESIPESGRVRGAVRLRIPRTIQVVRDRFPESIRVHASGLRVTVDLPDSPTGPLLANEDAIQAFGESGSLRGALQMLPVREMKLNDSGRMRTRFFWGTVSSVQLILTRDWTDVSLPFDLPLARPLTDDQKGR